jgi:hypothetical protein
MRQQAAGGRSDAHESAGHRRAGIAPEKIDHAICNGNHWSGPRCPYKINSFNASGNDATERCKHNINLGDLLSAGTPAPVPS